MGERKRLFPLVLVPVIRIMLILQVALWFTLGLIVWAYIGFPLLLLVRGVFRRPVSKAENDVSISLVIVAHNEEQSIGAKIENMLALDYPRDQVEIIIASDGSDDRTHEIVRGFASRGVRLCEFPRQGKIPALNAAVEQASNEILVFSDANSMFDPGSLKALTRCFADSSVGAVAGDQRYDSHSGNAASFGERAYWSFDRFLKQMQSQAGNATSSTGAIHAIRRSLFQSVPTGVCDDFVISTRAIEQGHRLVFEPNAIAYEEVAPTDEAEFRRKSRVIARGLRGLWAVRGLFNPLRHGFYSLQLASHKLLRWSVIWLMPIVLVLSMLLAQTSPVYMVLAVGQGVFYVCALAGWILRRAAIAKWRVFKVAAIPFYFCLVNIAALSGWMQLFAGRRVDVWSPNRTADSA